MKRIRIPVIIGEDGRWVAGSCDREPEPDWLWLFDMLGREDEDFDYQGAVRRVIVQVDIEEPKTETIVEGVTTTDYVK